MLIYLMIMQRKFFGLIFTENCYLKCHFKGVDLFNNYTETQRKNLVLIFTENCYLKCHFKGVDLFNIYAETQRKIFDLIFTENCYLKCHYADFLCYCKLNNVIPHCLKVKSPKLHEARLQRIILQAGMKILNIAIRSLTRAILKVNSSE